MKGLKRFAALMIAAMMVIGSVVPAMAADTPKLTYKAGEGATGADKVVLVASGQIVNLADNAPNYFAKEHAHLNGWSVGGTKVETVTVGTADIDALAVWEDDFRITYSTAHGTAPTDDAYYARNATATAAAAPTTEDAFAFKGWSATGSDVVTYEAGASITMDGNKTLTAVWNPIYTITYEGGTPAPETKENGETYTVSSTAPATTPEHKSFGGWSTDGVTPITSLTVNANTTLKPVWNNLVTVTYNADGGASDAPAASADNVIGSTITLPSYADTTKTVNNVVYNFRGWKDPENNVYAAGSAYTIPADDVELKANWVPQDSEQNGLTRHEEPDGTVTYIDNTDPENPVTYTNNPNVSEITNGDYEGTKDEFGKVTPTVNEDGSLNPITDSPINVTVNSHDHSSYKAVQIFSGTQVVGNTADLGNNRPVTISGDNNPLGNIQWGSGAIGHEADIIQAVNDTFGTSLVTSGDNQATAQEVAEAIATRKQTDLNSETPGMEPTGVQEFDDSRALALAKKLSQILKDAPATTLSSQGRNEVDPGYYLIIDTTQLTDSKPTEDGQEGDAQNASLLQMTRDITITKKTDAPKIDKQILEETDNGVDYVDANTAYIDEKVNYQIKSAVPDHTYYNYYYFVINDTLSEGLTFNPNSLEVWTQTGDGAETLLPMEGNYYLYTKDNATDAQLGGKTFMVAFENIKSFAPGTKIFVRYSATLNKKAKIGSTGNPNDVTLSYSSSPDQSDRGEKEKNGEDNSLKGVPFEGDNVPTQTTLEEHTITYTTALKIKKVGEVAEGELLSGAGFTLTGDMIETVFKNKEYWTTADDSTATFSTTDTNEYWKLKNVGDDEDGYTTDAPITADTMSPIAVGSLKGYVALQDGEVLPSGVDIETIEVGGTTYRAIYTNEDGTAFATYTYTDNNGTEHTIDDTNANKFELIKANADQYDDVTTKYKKAVATDNSQTTTTPVEMYLETDEDGIIIFKGLAAGTYTLEETKVPEGYNKAKVYTVVITGSVDGTDMNSPEITITTGEEKASWKATFTPEGGESITVDLSTHEGGKDTYVSNIEDDLPAVEVLETTIIDAVGSMLPETGGIGTTIFYAGGAILVLLAGVLLVSKRRFA